MVTVLDGLNNDMPGACGRQPFSTPDSGNGES